MLCYATLCYGDFADWGSPHRRGNALNDDRVGIFPCPAIADRVEIVWHSLTMVDGCPVMLIGLYFSWRKHLKPSMSKLGETFLFTRWNSGCIWKVVGAKPAYMALP